MIVSTRQRSNSDTDVRQPCSRAAEGLSSQFFDLRYRREFSDLEALVPYK